MRRWMPSVRRQPLRCNSSAVARTPGPAPVLRTALTPGPSPALRAALTPGPSPALRERGDLMDAASLQDADAGSLLRREPPLPLPVGERKGAGEKVWWHTPPSSPAAWERKGAGGKVRAALTPSPAPALRALRWSPRLSQKYASRDGFGTRPYQRDERQSCGPPAPPAPLPRCGPCGGLHVCLRNTLGGTGLKPMFASSS
jgi:hypothetical protein